MPRKVWVDVNAGNAKADLAEIKKQIPFAMSLALNKLGAKAKAEQTEGIFERFQVKPTARPRVKTTVQMKPSTKRRPEVVLTERDPWLVQHEEGETRRPGDIFSSVVKPVSAKARRVGVLRGRNTPAAVLATGRGFIRTLNNGKIGVFLRRGRKRLPVDLVFALEREAKLPALLKFGATVDETVTREWDRVFAEALRTALGER